MRQSTIENDQERQMAEKKDRALFSVAFSYTAARP